MEKEEPDLFEENLMDGLYSPPKSTMADGSSNSQFWPILGKYDIENIKDPFEIGIFHSTNKNQALLSLWKNAWQNLRSYKIMMFFMIQ
jgi:hypothetical protein